MRLTFLPLLFKCLLLPGILIWGVLNACAQNINSKHIGQLLRQLPKSYPDTNRLNLLMELGSYYVFKPGEIKSDLDSGYYYTIRAMQLSQALHLVKKQHENQVMLMVISMERRDDQRARMLFKQAIHDFRKSNDKEAEALLHFRLGIWLTSQGNNVAEALYNYTAAAGIYRALHQPDKELRVLKEIASIHFDEGKVDTAEKELLHVLNRYKAIHYPRLHYTYNLLSTVSRVKGDFNKGLMYAMLCIKSMNSSHDTSSAANFYADLARMYMEVGKHDKGIEWYKKALARWRQQTTATFGMYICASYLAQDLIRQSKAREALGFMLALTKDRPPVSIIQKACVAQNLAYCYDAMHNFKMAEVYYRSALQLYVESKMDFEVSQESQRAIGRFYLARGAYDKAGTYLRATLKASPQKLSIAALKDVHYMLFRVDSAQGNYIAAINHFKRHKQLNDSIFNSRKAREIEELQIQYETEKKTQDLVLLKNKSKLQQNELAQAGMTQRYTLGGLALLLIIVGLLFNQYRQNRRSNNELQLQQKEISHKNNFLQQVLIEKEWLLKEIHHRVKNNLQIVISLLNTQSTYLENDIALSAIRESQHRMYSISLIHQKLYQSDNLALINMPGYIRDLVSYLKDSFDASQNIHFEFSLMPVKLDVSHAVPVGLILNEAVTNAIKYAVKPNGRGNIGVSFLQQEVNTLILTITDDGPGFPPAFDMDNCNSLGINLIKGLSLQLNGNFSIHRAEHLTQLTVMFKYMNIPDNTRASIADLQDA